MPKNRPCRELDCPYPCIPQKRSCGFHWLLNQPIELQEKAALSRLARATASGLVEYRSRVPAAEWPPGTRWCSGCQSFIPLFYARGSRCRACSSMTGHRARVEKEYIWPEGVTYDVLLARQHGRCAICGSIPRSRRLAVDHDHESGLVRGLLCSADEGASCNKGLLGSAHDSVTILRAAVAYLEQPPSGAPGQA